MIKKYYYKFLFLSSLHVIGIQREKESLKFAVLAVLFFAGDTSSTHHRVQLKIMKINNIFDIAIS